MTQWMSSNLIRSQFSALMSKMYQNEVPLYGDLIELVAEVNRATLKKRPLLEKQLQLTDELHRLSQERHGAIRVGTAEELNNLRRIFAVMGMYPVGYYDLVPAGVPVHATAFRAIDRHALKQCPFRIFTSLLRLELIDDPQLRSMAEMTLLKRQIFTPSALALTRKFEQQGGLDERDAQQFIQEVIETFRWHTHSPVSKSLYDALNQQHRLIADVVAFKGPHINHLTPRTLDIDTVQQSMQSRGITPKAVIEGPPQRECPILLRQTSFKALEENVSFVGVEQIEAGQHSARFGEIEQRGVALTAKGRALYDRLLQQARQRLGAPPDESNAPAYSHILEQEFQAFPDSYAELHAQKLAYFYYFVQKKPKQAQQQPWTEQHVETLINEQVLAIEPIVYEDFLPVSAAGIFQSNLGDDSQSSYATESTQAIFEQCLGTAVHDEMEIYRTLQQKSLQACLTQLNVDQHVAAMR